VAKISYLAGLALLICSLAAVSCGSQQPDVYGKVNQVIVGFEDGNIIHLSQESPLFQDMADEGMRIVYSAKPTSSGDLYDGEIEAGKYAEKYVELDFAQPTDVRGYGEITNALILLTNREPLQFMIDDNILVKLVEADGSPAARYGLWRQWHNERGTNRLERLADHLR
jgi:hypothetical protein